MSAIGGRDRARRLAGVVGVVVLGLAVALGVFIQYQTRDPRAPEDAPRALAIPAIYATMGLLAVIGAFERRPVIVVAAGVLCLAGTIVSVAAIGFAVPGVLLIRLGSRIGALPRRPRSEAVIAAAAVLLVVSAAIALLGMTEGRCWEATGSPADPTYSVISCGGQAVLVAGGQTFASGFDSGGLTTGGGLVEAVLLLGALTLTVVTGRIPTRAGQPSIDQARPLDSAASPVREGQAGPGAQLQGSARLRAWPRLVTILPSCRRNGCSGTGTRCPSDAYEA